MEAARRLVHRHVRLAALLIALALCVKVLVPTGFMPVLSAGGVTFQPCPDAGPAVVPAAGIMPGMAMADHGADHDGTPDGHAAPEMPCAFAGLAVPSLAAVDPVVLAIAVAGMLATVFRLPDRVPARRVAHLRPPLRGPPTTA